MCIYYHFRRKKKSSGFWKLVVNKYVCQKIVIIFLINLAFIITLFFLDA